MGLDFAIDALYATAWQTLDTTGCECTPSGQFYPGVERTTREFAEQGYELAIRKVDLFDCYRAEWTDRSGQPVGGVVGATPEEAAVYALALHRRAAMQSLVQQA